MTYKLLLDTNVLLDYVLRRPEYETAMRLLRAVAERSVEGCVCSLSLKDLYYVSCKAMGEPDARAVVRDLMQLLEVLPIGANECRMSVESNEPDFEDGLVRAAAESNDVDFIVTRDVDAFTRSSVRSVSPGLCLDIIR